MGKTTKIIVILSLVVMFWSSCLRKSQEEYPQNSNDSCGICKSFSITDHRFEHFHVHDTLILNYHMGEKISFRRAAKDTLVFSVSDRSFSILEGYRLPCICYFNKFDYLSVSFDKQDSIGLYIRWKVSDDGQTKMDRDPNFHNIMISFKNINFHFYPTSFVKDSTYTIYSTTLKTYICTIRNGKITKFVTQGGEQWEVLN